jgi:hypothetical protein
MNNFVFKTIVHKYTDSTYLRQFNCDPFFIGMLLMADGVCFSVNLVSEYQQSVEIYIIGKKINFLWNHDHKRLGKFYSPAMKFLR